ncbi:deoxynucleoside kinase-like isoform X2 [Tribolium madens]|uniref:deoxynucleoside kinase-like isoform X2 n=1 Tax=Tribolium madens TaxID=41895 RepID=UPI001CF75DB9|nr:deoxynucleoside kinase-like isoform X2 [Tribolium madens]
MRLIGCRKILIFPSILTRGFRKRDLNLLNRKIGQTMESVGKRPFRVSIEGNIGAGKSTLIDYFSRISGIETYGVSYLGFSLFCKFKLFQEPIESWRNVNGDNLLDLMYSNFPQWLKVFQNYVQLSRLKVQTSKPKNPNTTVQIFERSLQNNRFCFVELAHKGGYLSGPDYAVLDEWYQWIQNNINIDLDLIVYLRSTPEVVYERIKARGRPEERRISLDYLRDLHQSHEEWLMKENSETPVLVMDADKTLEEVKDQFKQNEKRILGC